VIVIVAMAAFVCLFSHLIYKEDRLREHKMKEKQKAEQKGKKIFKATVE
jgi:preprotein translocase subunit YajC